jgi:hypothetical protein
MVLAKINYLELSFEELNFNFSHVLGDISVDNTPACLKVKDLKISRWNLLEEIQVRNLNLGIEVEQKIIKINNDFDLVITTQTEQLLKEYKDVFAWSYKDLKGIPPHIAQH